MSMSDWDQCMFGDHDNTFSSLKKKRKLERKKKVLKDGIRKNVYIHTYKE